MFKFKSILVPTDFSDQFQLSLNYAKELATNSNAVLHIIHVAEHNVYPADLGITQTSFIDLEMELNKKSTEQLDNIRKELEDQGFKVVMKICAGRASDKIIEYAFDEK